MKYRQKIRCGALFLFGLASVLPGLANAAPAAGEEDSHPGKAVYEQVCATCHEAGVPRAPSQKMLYFVSPQSIYRALTEGVMQPMATGLSNDQKIAVAEYLTGSELVLGEKPDLWQCEGEAARFDYDQPPKSTGWGMTRGNTREVASDVAGITRANVQDLKLKWAFAFPETTRVRSQPMVAGGAVFGGSQGGYAYALEKNTGCVRWQFRARAEVRTAVIVSPWKVGDRSARPMAYFGGYLGNLYALDAVSGELVWERRPDEHPDATISGAPTLHKGTLYVPVSAMEVTSAIRPAYECCTFRGSVVAYDARTGKQLWKTYTIPEAPSVQGKNSAGADRHGPAGAPVWNSPAIDLKRNQLLVGTGQNYSSPASKTSDSIIAMDLGSGQINWVFQATENDVWNGACEMKERANCPAEDGPDVDFGGPPVVATASDGRDYVVAGQKSGDVWALEPATGKVIWSRKMGRGGLLGGVHFGIAVAGDRVFVPINDSDLVSKYADDYDSSKWPGEPNPGLYALDIKTGKVIWEWQAVSACGNRPGCKKGNDPVVTATPELVFAGSQDGHLRIHDAATGEVLWTFNTAREFITPSGGRALGGSLEGPTGAVLKDGMMFLNSGYLFNQHMPGNALLAFTVKKDSDDDKEQGAEKEAGAR